MSETSIEQELAALRSKAACAESVYEAMENLLTRLESKERDALPKSPEGSERFPYIPLPRASFVQMLVHVKRLLGAAVLHYGKCGECGADILRRPVFVDVGCGLADKVHLAASLFFEAHGIEVDSDLVRAAKARFAFRECHELAYAQPQASEQWDGLMTLYPADALRFDYSGFDVIYFYRPLRDEKLQRALERRIWSQARPGSFIIACSGITKPPRGKFVALTDHVGYAPPKLARIYRRRGKLSHPER